ncbi:MAG: glycoside hydrolase family 28 protein, partial [Bacteroidales bacterium]|nr:glycoside hydrolase family 28 protein [Bacteroidales bacterium]
MRRILLLFTAMLTVLSAQAQIHQASSFGVKSDGVTLNTRSIQAAIDYISSHGGGVLELSVGRYLTGSIFLKDNVELRLLEGAVLVGSTNPYDYDMVEGYYGLLLAKGQKNISVKGKGVIDGRGFDCALNFLNLVHLGLLEDTTKNDRVTKRPKLIYFRECENVEIEGVNLRNSAEWTLVTDQCENLTISGILLDSKNYWNNDGLDIVDCRHVLIKDSFIDASDDAICFKSHSAEHLCEDIEVRNCVARSSASGFKFGTVSKGGFKNIRIINNKVYDTHRSAITIQSVDGGEVENILVDNLEAVNTSNAIYLRSGIRWNNGKKGYLKNITLSNIKVEVPLGKADAGYSYEGPIEDLPRNISPSGIVGIPDIPIENVVLKNVEIIYPGGGNKNYAYRGTSPEELDSIPEMIDVYPEFSQFKELPAWGLFIRHAKGITLDNVRLVAGAKDYRPAVVADDV